jgi:nicotinamide riboside transporter PnuC
MNNIVWTISLALIGLIGLHIAGKKSQWGWCIGLCVQVLWIIFAIVSDQYGFILSALGYGFVNANNWRKWRKEQPKREHVDRSADWSV